MPGKIILLLIVYAAIWIADLSMLRKLARREIAVYVAVVMLSVYLGIDYAGSLQWPFLEDAASFLLGEPARIIVKFLKAPS